MQSLFTCFKIFPQLPEQVVDTAHHQLSISFSQTKNLGGVDSPIFANRFLQTIANNCNKNQVRSDLLFCNALFPHEKNVYFEVIWQLINQQNFLCQRAFFFYLNTALKYYLQKNINKEMLQLFEGFTNFF